MSDEIAPKNINEAILAVMGEVDYVQKTKSPQLRYTFANEGDIINALRPAMLKHGILMFCSGIDEIQLREFNTGKGTPMLDAHARFTWKFIHAPSGSEISVVTNGEGADMSDKAMNKCTTSSKKYALLTTFLLVTGDDPDQDQDNDRGKPSMVDKAKSLGGKEAFVEHAGKKLVYRSDFLEELVNVDYFTNIFEADNALKKSKSIFPDATSEHGATPLKNIMWWVQQYNAFRHDDGMTSDEAADNADLAYEGEKVRQAQNKSTGA